MRTLGLATIGLLLAIPSLKLAARVTGFAPLQSPGETALSAIVALSIGQVWVAMLGTGGNTFASSAMRTVAAAAAIPALACLTFGLYRFAEGFLSPVLTPVAPTNEAIAWITALVPVFGITGLVIFKALLPESAATAPGRSLRVHALHGFYLGAIADRLIEKLFGSFARREVVHV